MAHERLDISAIEAAYPTSPLPSAKRSDGIRVVLGEEENAAVAIDIFPEDPP